MTKLLDVTQGHANLFSEFSEPQFSLLKEPPVLYRQLLQRLGSHGARLADMKAEWGDQSLADYSIRCFLLNFAVTLRFRIERLEIFVDTSRVSETDASEIAGEVFEAVQVILPDSSFRSHTADIGIHGTVAETSPSAFIGAFMKEPPNLGPSTGSGCIFYFGPHETRLSHSVTLDISAALKEGLYVRDFSVWDGSKINAPDLIGKLPSHLDTTLQALDLKRAD